MNFPFAQDKKKNVYTTQWIRPQPEHLRCDCSGCSSYKGTGESGDNFCALGKSTKITIEKGCICERCPMAIRAGSKEVYCCTRGTRTLTMFDDLMKKLK